MKQRGSRSLTLGNSGSGLWVLEHRVAIRRGANISIDDTRCKGSVTCRVGGARSDDLVSVTREGRNIVTVVVVGIQCDHTYEGP